MENARKFYEELKNNPELSGKAKEIGELNKGADEATSFENVAKVARESGYAVTAGDIESYAKASRELGEVELEDVAGGSGSRWSYALCFTFQCWACEIWKKCSNPFYDPPNRL